MFKNKEIFGIEKEVVWLESKAKYNTLKKIPIYEGQPDILAYIYMHKNTTQYDIARYLGISRASVGISLKRMEKCGYILVSLNEANKRSTCVNITEKGIKVLVQADMVLNDFMNQKFDGFTDKEKEAYLILMQKMRRNLKKMYKASMEENTHE